MSNKVKLTELGDAEHKVDSSATIDTAVGGSAAKSAAKVKLIEMPMPQSADATPEDRERLRTQMSLSNMTRGYLGDELEDTRQSIEDYNPQMYAQQRRMAAYDKLESGDEQLTGTRSRITDIYRDVEAHNPADSYIGKKHKVADAMVSSLPTAGENTTDVMLGDTRFTREEAYDAMVGMVEQTMHQRLFTDDPRYRSDYFIKNYGTSLRGYLQQLDNTLAELGEALDSEAGREIGALIDAQTHPDAFVGQYIGALAGKESHGAGMIREARDHIRSIIDNDFTSGFAEAFDWTTMLTGGVNELMSGVVLNNVLNKAFKGERLTAREEVAYKAYQVSEELNQLHEMVGGRSTWNNIGMGVGESTEMMPQFAAAMTTGGAAAGALGVGLRNLPIRAAGKMVVNSFRKGVLNGIKTGVLTTGRLAGTAALNVGKAEAIGMASSIIMPSTWGNFVDKRNGQFKMKDGKLTFTPSTTWKDAVDAWIEGGAEVGSEMIGGRISTLLGGSARAFGRLIGVDKIASKMGIGKASRTLFGYKKPAFVRNLERNVGFAGPLAEPLSEVWGDASANLLKGAVTGRDNWENITSKEYWLTTLGACAIYGGALTTATSALPIAKRYAQIGIYGHQRKKHLEQIEDAELYNAVVEALAIEDMDEAAQKLASLDWKRYHRIDMGNAMDAIRADYAQRVAIGAEEETARLNYFAGVASRASDLAYRGKDGTTLEDYILRIKDKDGIVYSVISGDATSQFYICYDANFNKVSIPTANVVETSQIAVGEEISNEYDTLFSMEGEMRRQSDLIEAYESLRDGMGVGERIKGLAQQFGVPVRESGDNVTLADGTTRGVVWDYIADKGEYIVATEDGGMVTVPFYDALSDNESVAEAQTLNYAQRKQTQVQEALDAQDVVTPDGNVVTTPTASKYAVGDIVYTPTGAQVRVRAINSDGSYEVDHNLEESVSPADMQLESFNEADLRGDAAEAVEEVQMQEVEVSPTEEVITTEGVAPTEEEIKHDEITPVPMNDDGTINYDAIEDPQQYATLYAQEAGGVEAAIEEVRDMRTAIEEEVAKSMEKWKKAKTANEKMQNRRERNALAARMAFYDNVLNILEAQIAPTEAVEATTSKDARMSVSEAGTVSDAPQTEAETPVQREAGLVENEYTPRLRASIAEMIDALAKTFGLVVEFVDDVYDADTGARANADIRGNVVRIAWRNRTRSISFLIGHEFTHRMQDLSTAAYDSFKEAVIKFLGEDVWNARVDAMVSLYERAGITRSREELEDEVTADVVGMLVRDKHAFETFLENKSKGFIQRIIDVFESIFAYVSSRIAHNKEVKGLLASLKDLVAVAAEVQKSSVEAEEKTRFSLPVIQGLSEALNEYKGNGDIATFVERVREVNDNIALNSPIIGGKLAYYEEDGNAEEFEESIEKIVAEYGTEYAPYTAGNVRYSIDIAQIEAERDDVVEEVGDVLGEQSKLSLATDVALILEEYDTEGVKFGSILDVADAIESLIAESAEDTTELENILNDLRAAQDDARRWGNRMDSGGEEEFEEALRLYASQGQPKFSLQEVNTRFNEELATLTEENKDKVILSLGTPSKKLLAGGVTNKPMKLYGAKVIKKQKLHGFNLSEIKDLPLAVANPIAVFNNYQSDENRSVLTELTTKDGNFLVSLNVGKGEDIDFNIVATVFGKGDDNIVDWFNRGLATYIDKEKALDYLHHSALNAEALSNPRLISTANIIQNFQNPNISTKFFLITPEMDASYLEAVKRGDMATAQDTSVSAPTTETQVLTTANGDMVAEVNEQTGQARLSLLTYEDGGRDTLARFLEQRVANGALTTEEAEQMLVDMDRIYDVCNEYKDKYAPFGTWSEAKVVTDDNGNPVFSVIKENGDYAMNLDFSLVCKKRRTLDAVLNEMIKRGMINSIPDDPDAIATINDVIRRYGFETACRLCFVDAKRFRVLKVANDFAKMYNDVVNMLKPRGKKIPVNYFSYAVAREDVEGGMEMLPDEELNISAVKKIAEGKKVINKIAKHLLENPQDRRYVQASDFVSTLGFDNVKTRNPKLLSLYNSKKGSGGPKAAFSDVQYLNDILATNWSEEAAYAVGGVRLQSFSDFVPRMVFDYIQMVADLAAKGLPVHAYTKEPLFAKIFGLTGIKINLSLVPKVVEGGVAAGLDADGNYAWQEGETFPYDVAVEIQNAKEYSANCGTIAVGVSDEHILKMLYDTNIRMVIPYHKSGLNKKVAIHNNIAGFKDYTNEQNTRKGNKKVTSAEVLAGMPNFNEEVRKTNDPRKAADAYLAWCKSKGYTPKFNQFAGHPNYYKLLEDFTTLVDEVYVPQEAVTFTFPDEQSAFGSLPSLIEQGLDEDAILEGQRDEKVTQIVDELEGIRFSLMDNAPAAEVGEVTMPDLEENNTMHAVNVTDSMRESVMQGHPKFSLIGEMGAANLDAYDEATTRLDNLEVARDMEAMARDASAIKYATGWERGADGLWRYEVDDEITSYTISRLKKERNDVLAERAARIAELKEKGDSALLATYNALPEEYFLLEEVLGEDHPIFAAYPTFRNMRVILAPYRYQSYEGYYDNGTNTILIVDKSGNDLREASVLAHEIQHAIQHKEGFERGTNLDKVGSIDEYNRHAGEVEARNVQTRLLYTPEQRRATIAAATEDVAREDQIMLRKGVAEDGAARQSLYDAPFFNDEGGEVIYFEDDEMELPAIEVRPRTTEGMIKIYMDKRHLAAKEKIRKETRDIIAVTRKLYKERDAERRKTIHTLRTNAAKIDFILGDIDRESISLFDQALIAIAEGMVHIRWDSDGTHKGIAAEIGLKDGEKKYYSSITKNATQSVEGFVHDWWESMNGYERGIDVQELRNALIDALRESPTATRAIEILRDKYDTALREMEDAIAQAEAQQKKLLADEKTRYEEEVAEFENSEDKASIIRYYEQGQLLNEDMAIAHGALRAMERELNSIRNQLDNKFIKRQISLAEMRKGIEAAKAAVMKAIEDAAVLKFNRRDVATLIDKLKDARSLNDVDAIRKRVEGTLQGYMLRQANNDIHRLLQMRLPNGELAETWIGRQIANGIITAADGKRIMADLWRGHNNKGVSVAKFVHGDTADAMVMLRKMVEENSKREVLERKEVTGEDGKVRTVAAKFGDDKELSLDVEAKRMENIKRIESLEQQDEMSKTERVEYEARLLYDKYLEVVAEKQHVNNIREDIERVRNNDNIEESRKREIINSLYKALPRAKAAYLKSMQDFAAEVSSYMAEGRDKLKAFREAKEKHRNDILALGRNAVGDVKVTDNPPTVWERIKASARATISDPDYTYMTTLRVIDYKAPNGEGKFYEHFAYAAQQASDNFFNAQYVHYSRLKDAIAQFFPELKGMNPFKAYAEIMRRTDEIAVGTIQYAKAIVNGKIKEHTTLPLNLSNAMYVVAMWDQPRYQVGMAKHGITEDVVNNLKEAIPEEYKNFMAWVRDTFLPDTRNEYDEVHRRMFGISMDEEVNYFPARVMGYIKQVDISDSEKNQNAKPSVTTGAIISRKEHGLMPDVRMGYFQMLQAHIQNMDKWAAYAELNEEHNILASDNIFKSRLETMMPGDGRGRSGKGSLYDIYVSRCAIMAQCFNYAPTSVDDIALWFQKNWATANITHRYFTALKQLSGLAVYAVTPKDLTQQLGRFAKNPAKYMREVSELSPSFRQRWESRIAGSEILNKELNASGFADLNRSKRSSMMRGMSSLWSVINTVAIEWGMTPNAAVDAVVSAIGFMTLYEGSLNDMRKEGKEVTAADRKKAILEAEMRFNETQQSNEGAYLSRLQRQRSFLLAGMTTYRNASFGLHRLRKEALRELFKRRTEEEIDEMEKEYGEGAVARGKNKAWRKLMMGIFGEAAFIGMTLGIPALFAMLGGGEDDDETPLWEDLLVFLRDVVMQSTLGGYIGGDVLINLVHGYDYDLTASWTDLVRDMGKIWDIRKDDNMSDIFSWDRISIYSLTQFVAKYGIGVDTKTFANIVKGLEGTVEGMIYGDGTAEAILMFLNAPKSNIDAIAGRIREGETALEYMTRRLRLESIIIYSDYEDYFSEDGRYIGDKSNNDFRISAYTARNLLKEYNESYKRSVIRREGGVSMLRDVINTDNDYANIVKKMGWTPEARPNNKALEGGSYVAPVQSIEYGEYERLSNIQTYIAEMSDLIEKFAGTDEGYYALTMQIHEAKKNLIKYYDEFNE